MTNRDSELSKEDRKGQKALTVTLTVTQDSAEEGARLDKGEEEWSKALTCVDQSSAERKDRKPRKAITRINRDIRQLEQDNVETRASAHRNHSARSSRWELHKRTAHRKCMSHHTHSFRRNHFRWHRKCKEDSSHHNNGRREQQQHHKGHRWECIRHTGGTTRAPSHRDN